MEMRGVEPLSRHSDYMTFTLIVIRFNLAPQGSYDEPIWLANLVSLFSNFQVES